jgi:hypothetical protein
MGRFLRVQGPKFPRVSGRPQIPKQVSGHLRVPTRNQKWKICRDRGHEEPTNARGQQSWGNDLGRSRHHGSNRAAPRPKNEEDDPGDGLRRATVASTSLQLRPWCAQRTIGPPSDSISAPKQWENRTGKKIPKSKWMEREGREGELTQYNKQTREMSSRG